jgi:tRNA dimethylallyltransferase
MIEEGLIEEVKKLHERGGLSEKLPSIRCVGYRQIWQYLNGEINLNEAIEKSIIASRQLAKRQFTWLRSWEGLNQFDSDDPGLAKKVMSIIQKVSLKK